MPAPPVVQRRVLRWEAASVICELAGVALLFISVCAGVSPIFYLWAFFFATFLFASWRAGSRRKHFAGLAVEHSFQLCGNCAYPLHAIIEATRPERIRCPECGTEASVAGLEAEWREQFEIKPAPPKPFLPASKWALAACVAGIVACVALIGYLVADTFQRP
ncbi:MAG: hypothetical protein AMXMBFR47_27680 [Planctomycetota bacterium]